MLIYKYLATDRPQALDNATLRATQADALNDPFELKPFFRTIFEMSDLTSILAEQASEENLLDRVYEQLPENIRARLSKENVGVLMAQDEIRQGMEKTRRDFRTAVSHELPALSSRAREILHEQLGSKIGIISFTDDPTNPLMWSHYASEHRGYAIEFDGTHPFFDRRRSKEDEFFHLRPVRYMNNLSAHEKLADLDGTSVLCAKQSAWAYEREHRLLVPVDPSTQTDVTNPIHLIHFPRECVRSVILGGRSTVVLESELGTILQRYSAYADVKLRRATADFASGSIVISDVKATNI
ncbi:DUF2971 domain-containing protein [Rhodanobacter glycinis]|uniref:DUF2971 domain-containing protein n=1 Tax=Rhodanobacter glycinis TaxID=582702 RepID=UPI001126B0E3|nr:DUF2971 domain-containing protein [Rhodanobacter glycinis]TPG45552.1 DUF2971 domain-containing protein [Rhodanobacter glycinis]